MLLAVSNTYTKTPAAAGVFSRGGALYVNPLKSIL